MTGTAIIKQIEFESWAKREAEWFAQRRPRLDPIQLWRRRWFPLVGRDPETGKKVPHVFPPNMGEVR